MDRPLPRRLLLSGALLTCSVVAHPAEDDAPLSDKTLVVWASPATLEQAGGSALTMDKPAGLGAGAREPVLTDAAVGIHAKAGVTLDISEVRRTHGVADGFGPGRSLGLGPALGSTLPGSSRAPPPRPAPSWRAGRRSSHRR